VLPGGGASTHWWARAPMRGAAGSPSSHHPTLTAQLYSSRKISRGIEKKGVREKIVVLGLELWLRVGFVRLK
jgi:hypothetical protein